MTELVHHTDESAGGGASPFDTAIRDIVTDENVLIACPYITVEYLEPIRRDAASWRLLTDREAWLGNYNKNKRESIQEFIARYHEQIHDIRDLHAKAVIGETDALVGSANLTWTGLGSRDELGVRFDEPERIGELREWFDGLWTASTPAKLDKIDEHIKTSSSVPSSVKAGSGTSIPADARRVSASATRDSGTKSRASERFEESKTEHEKLVERVRKAPSREWIDRHFDWITELLDGTGLTDDDPILVTSIPKSGGIHVTINHRVVLAVMRPTKFETGFILSDDAENLEHLIMEATKHETFSNPNNVPAPHLLSFDDGLDRITNRPFRRGWLKAILNEVENRWEKAPRRRNHEPVVYRAATDYDYRERVLCEAFGG